MRRRRRSSHVFGTAPVLYHSRSQFNLSHSHKTAFSAGQLIPIYVQEVLPADTFKVDMSAVFRTPSPFLRPVMDNAFLDVFFFFVPNRLVFDNWENVFGSASPDGWTEPEAVSVPQVGRTDLSSVGSTAEDWIGTLADYFGIPIDYLAALPSNSSTNTLQRVSLLPFRAYAKIYNDWFRDENLIDPVYINTGAGVLGEVLNFKSFGPTNYTGKPAYISKTHDYFTQLLPSPQKGSPVNLPLTGDAPLIMTDGGTDLPVRAINNKYVFPASADFRTAPYNTQYIQYGRTANVATPGSGNFVNAQVSWVSSSVGGTIGTPEDRIKGRTLAGTPITSGTNGNDFDMIPANLWGDITNARADMSQVTASSINDLRFAFQLQKMLERDARCGSRYREFLLGAFGVSSPDARLQVSEYLGGARLPMSIFQVNQTSGESSASSSGEQGTPLATVGAYSLSNGRCRFAKSFVEHGFIIGLAAVRQNHTYQQGIERFWTRSDRTDYYDPIFMNIGEQPVYTSEIYATAPASQILGYNPAWEDYRYRPNRVSGVMRSAAGSASMDIWHFADYYASAPVLGAQFIRETASNIDRTLSVPSTSAPQFIADFYFKCSAVRAMPTYSVPGLIDHH